MERRSAVLPEEYRKPLAKLDQKYHHTQPGQVGPLESRLQGYGSLQCLVMGAFQEGSKDLHSRLKVLAESKLRVWELSLAKSYSSCLLGRVSRVGEENRNGL